MTDDQKPKAYEGWAIVQQMGHVTLAGYVTETQLAGFGVLSIAIPDGVRTVQQLIPPSTLYSLTWVGEEEARTAARYNKIEPVQEWTIRQEIRAKLEQDEAESIEQRIRRTVAREQQEASDRERHRTADLLNQALSVAQSVETPESAALIQAIETYADEARPSARHHTTHFVSTYHDDQDDRDPEDWE